MCVHTTLTPILDAPIPLVVVAHEGTSSSCAHDPDCTTVTHLMLWDQPHISEGVCARVRVCMCPFDVIWPLKLLPALRLRLYIRACVRVCMFSPRVLGPIGPSGRKISV